MKGPTCCEGGITGYGTPGGIVFVGIAPGKDEWLRSKRPMTGPTGQLLNAVLEAVGIKREDTYATNLCCFWKDAPDKDDIAKCAPRLKLELEQVQPRVIVALGALACENLFGMKLGKARGAVIKLPDGVYGLATWHPAACLHRDNPELQINASYDLTRDLSKLPSILNGHYDSFQEPTYTVITTLDDAQAFLNTLPSDVPIAIDIETKYDKESDKSHPFSDAITCIGIGYNGNEATVLTPDALSPELKWPKDVQWVYHNGSFDTQEIAKHLGVWLPISGDTMLQSYSCDERSVRGLHKLKSLSREFVGADFYEEEEHHGSPDQLYTYNAKDVVYTWRLYQHLRKWQMDEETGTLYEGILLPASEMLARSQYRGINISIPAMHEIEVVLGGEFINLHKSLTKLVRDLGFPDFNPNSPQQVRALLASQGHVVPNTAKATLNDLLDNTPDGIPFISSLLRYRMLSKLINTYLCNVQAAMMHDGRVHPHAFLTGTNTGRLTYKDPPMQTLPKPKTVGELGIVRKMFSVTDDSYILVERDYAQIEAWVAAYLSEDDTLLHDLQSGNWHTLVTEDVFKVTKQSVSAQQWSFYYDAGKHLNYGCLYEEGPEGLTRRPPIGMGCDINTAKQYHHRWHSRYHKFDEWREKIKWLAANEGYITTPFGFKRRFPFIVNTHQLRQAVNAPIQSTANHYTLTAAIKLWPKLEKMDAHLLFLEHDARYDEIPLALFDEANGLIKEVMEAPPLIGLPSIKTEADAGPNLAELVKIYV